MTILAMDLGKSKTVFCEDNSKASAKLKLGILLKRKNLLSIFSFSKQNI